MTDKLHYDDLTQITCPFGMLDAGTQQRLAEWPHDREWWDGLSWVTINTNYQLSKRATFRAKPAPKRVEDLDAKLEKYKWQPIETAPKDGTYILLRRAYGIDGKPITDTGLFTQVAAWWDEEGWAVYCSMVGEPTLPFEPSHWMHIPQLEFAVKGDAQ